MNQPKLYVTSALSCYDHLINEAIERICPSNIILETCITDNDRIEVNLVDDDSFVNGKMIEKVRREIRGFIDGFIAGCEYTECHGISKKG